MPKCKPVDSAEQQIGINMGEERPELDNILPDETNKRNKKMDKNTQIPLFEDDITSNEPNTAQPLGVRKSRPGESIYRTGKAEVRLCIKTQTCVGPSLVVGSEYLWVKEPAIGPIVPWVQLVLFHETISDTGVHFAYPQVLGEDPLNPDAWQECEQELFRESLQRWLSIDYGEDPGEYDLRIEYLKAKVVPTNPHFDQQLDAALSPYAIDNIDHPVVRRLRAIFCNPEDDHPPMEWMQVG